MHKCFIRIAALLGALCVALGAFAAHALKDWMTPDALAIFETGVKYQFYHVLALLFVGLIAAENRLLIWSGRLFIIGIIIFCGSLYFLAVVKTMEWPLLWIGAITPLGGISFIFGWIFLAVGISKNPLKNKADL